MTCAEVRTAEIYDIQTVRHHTEDLVWIACLRTYPPSHSPIEYIFFIADEEIGDVRTTMLADKCGQQQYQSLEPFVRAFYLDERASDTMSCK